MRVEGVGYVYNPYIDLQKQNNSAVETTQTFSKDQMMQILNFMVYQQNGLAMKLVRVATENYLKAQMNQLA